MTRLAAGLVIATLLAVGAAWAGPVEDAARLEEAGDDASAADAYRQALKAEPDSHEALLGLARTVVRAKRCDLLGETEAALQGRLEQESEAHDVRLHLGRVLLTLSETTTSPGVAEASAHRAKAELEKVVLVEPKNVDAVLGLARALVLLEAPSEGIATLDAWLALGEKPPPALLLRKGKILYGEGRRLHAEAGGTWPLPPNAKRAFERARGALLSASAADAACFDAWIHLAWAAQTLGEREDALQGYENALVLRPDDPLPLRGLAAYFAHDPEGFEKVLRRLVRDRPEARRVLLLQGWDRVQRKQYDDAVRILDAYLKERPDDADALFYLARAHDGRGEEEDALVLYRLALENDPRHLQAADQLERRIRKTAMALAKKDLASCKQVQASYEDLITLAPENPYLRNNLAFVLRDSWQAHATDEAWREVLDDSVRHYEAAAEVIGPWTPKRGETIPWAKRYHYAQFVCDAAVIRQNYAPVKDLIQAEHHYLESLRWSEHGYLDSWTYLAKIYEAQERWDELKRLADRCANGLRNEKGEPLEKQRAAARARAERLVNEGKAK